jgi:hypothetical protein
LVPLRLESLSYIALRATEAKLRGGGFWGEKEAGFVVE